MTPQELKNSILQLAIQGKLVEQRPEEGTAAALYKQIQSEKQALIKAGMIKKEKSLPEITEDEVPFEIPDSWMWVRLRDICTKIVDGDHNPPAGISEITPYWMLSAQNINKNQLSNLDQVRYLTEEVFLQENERTRVQPGDIFFTIVATLGRSCVYEGGYNVCFQRSVSVISTLTFNYFLKYALDSGYIQQFMVANATGTAQKGFYLNQVEKLLIALPPLAEQKRIVAKIEELLPLIDRYEQAWSRLEDFNKRFPGDMQKSILQMAIQGKLVEQRPEEGTGEELYHQIQREKQALIKAGKIKKEKPYSTNASYREVPFDIPDSWLFVRFGELMTSRDSERIPVSTAERAHREKVYDYYGASGVIDKIDDYLFDKELLLIGEDGANLLARSTPIAFLARGKYWVNNHAHVLDGCSGLNLKYICYYINAISLAPYVTGTAQPKMNQENMNAIWVALPPLAEQKRIVARLEELLPLCERLKLQSL